MKTPAIALLASLLLPLAAQDAPAPAETKPIEPVAPNVETPKTEAPAPLPQAEPVKQEPTKYTVKSGDNPWKIAKDHGVELAALLAANEIKDPKNLAIGDVLVIPGGGKTVAKPEAKKEESKPAAPAAPESGDGWKLYTIEKGDNPWKIAKSLGVDHQKILALNEGLDFTKLAIGQKIKVPTK